ncbi:MAG: hypothetical protein QXX30_00400 [Candidatus Aenigmatarchaeota archaeon]
MAFSFKDFPAERLYKISKRIVDLAFFMGGYRVRYYEAERCNYVFPSGKNCFNEHTLSPSIHCPVCGGSGVVYREPIEIRAIAIDVQNKPQKRIEGIQFIDNLRLVVPAEVPVKLIKLESTGKMFYIRDRFDIYSSKDDIWHSVFVSSEPKDVWLAGILYKSFTVNSSRLSVREATGNVEINIDGLEKEIQSIIPNTQTNTKVSQNTENENLEEIIKNILGK